MTDTPTRTRPAELHLVNGQVVQGVLQSFAPSHVALSLSASAGDRQESAENVAWIAFRKGTHEAPQPVEGAEAYRIHVAGGTVLKVRARPDDLQSDVGFFAYPVDNDDTSEELFVYAHGMNGSERDLQLGAMLLAEGLLDSDMAAQDATAQSNGRRLPISLWLAEQHNPNAVDEAGEAQRLRKVRLGELLVEGGYASQADVDLAVGEQRRRAGKRLGEVLVEIGIVSEADLARALAKKFQVPLVDLDEVAVNPAALREVRREVMTKYGVLPVDVDQQVLTVAIADPLATDAIDMLRFESRRRIRVVLVTTTQLRQALGDAGFGPLAAGPRPPTTELGGIAPASAAPPSTGARPLPGRPPPIEIVQDVARDKDGVIRIVNHLIQSAAQRGASDIHIEPRGDDKPINVRFRIDGHCVTAPEIAGRHRSALTVRLKVMANLDIAERRRPQDGKIRLATTDGRSIDVRVTSIPTIDDNEDIVLRILTGSRAVTLDDLQLTDKNAEAARSWLQLDHGLILCVGPTGVGKTTTVHGLLSALNTAELKVWTAEDPVEIVGAGLRQVHVQPKIDLTFAAALRTFLRADPDVIMIGEMRDQETAALAVEASLTGHLVLSTLHTKSAADTVARLLDMGLDPFTVADALSGVLSQRLVRRLCERCKTGGVAAPDDLEALERGFGADVLARAREAVDGALTLWHAVGCDACGRSGYSGRIALHELLTVDDEVRPLIARRALADELRRVVEQRHGTLREDGLKKALAGLTDLREVLAVTGH